MPINNYSVGRDLTLAVRGANGMVTLPGLISFKSRQDTKEEKFTKIDGVTQHVRFQVGWSGSFMLNRKSSSVDDYFAQLEANYYSGIADDGVQILETIQEANGSVSQYLYTEVLLKLDDAGEWAGDKVTAQSLSFICSRRKKLA